MTDLTAMPADYELPVPNQRKYNAFIGPNGLRAGWSLAIYILIIVALGAATTFTFSAIHHHYHPDDRQHRPQTAAESRGQQAKPSGAKSDILQEISVLCIVFLATWIMSRIEKRPFGEYGLGGNSRRWPQFFQGFVWGFVLLSTLILILRAGNYIVFDGVLLHGGALLKYAAVWLIFFLMVGLFEEFMFRGYIQYTLARGIGRGAWGFWIAAFLWNFGFGFAHGSNPGESPIGLFLAGFVGLMFCVSLWYTRSLWWAIGAHATWDWGESYFYGTADSGTLVRGHLMGSHPQGSAIMSGGLTGPEGSIFALLACILIGVAAWATLRRERDKSTSQALVNPLVDPFVSPVTEPVA